MRITLEINGKKIPATVDDKDVQKAMGGKEKRTGYEMAQHKEKYYREGVLGEVDQFQKGTETRAGIIMFDNGNYYTDETVARNNIRADALMRKLRRFAAEHGGCVSPSLAVSGNVCCYSIRYDSNWCDPITYAIYNQGNSVYGGVLFYNESAVLAAIEHFHDELLWYFTKYNPMPNGWWDD